MTKKKVLLYVAAALCILWVILMAEAAVRVYSEGAAYQAQGHPEVWIYTREKAVAAFAACAPVLLAACAVTLYCAAMGVRDERQDKPVADPHLIRIYREERKAAPDQVRERGKEKKVRAARAVLFVLAAVFIIAGIVNGSMEDVLIKAVNICTECIGLG